MARILTDNCGTPWNQTFSFDTFGNINKTGSSSFTATYNTSTNRLTAVGSLTPTYDSNGKSKKCRMADASKSMIALVAGVDLNHAPLLITRKLLISQHATTATIAGFAECEPTVSTRTGVIS